ncbi:hse-5, partial [Pristionchus pacificus]
SGGCPSPVDEVEMRVRSSLRRAFPYLVILSFLYWLNYYFTSPIASTKSLIDLAQPIQLNCTITPVIPSSHDSITCTVDDLAPLSCLKSDQEVYFPFSFLKKHLDVSGKIKDGHFEWHTSYAKMRLPEKTYNSSGLFGHFATYSVETRERVKCINPITGVPMSTQWNVIPYYYPIQIAQYGLEHYSRLLSQGNESRSVVVGVDSKEWRGAPGSMDETSERVFFVDEEGKSTVNFSTKDDISNPGVYVSLSSDSDLATVSFSFKSHSPNSSFSILLTVKEGNQLILLHYVPRDDDRCVWSEDSKKMVDNQITFFYSLPFQTGEWMEITRDVLVDAARALSTVKEKGRTKKEGNVILRPGDITIHSLSFRGHFTILQQIIQSRSENEKAFIHAADWFVANQDSSGGWPVGVERKVADGRLSLPSGWYSAMGQGHALSLLSRAYGRKREERYLKAAEGALKPFAKMASEGGVRNMFFTHPWFEEYPTTPGTFVLNGFMYSLIGLHDYAQLEKTSPPPPSSFSSSFSTASSLFQEGLTSLRALLPLYDTGSGSMYDLRHVALNTPPNLARWDYHAVHVYLLKWLVAITGDGGLDQVANRWIDYANGKKAKHN